jgi:hypothetical protein
MLEGVNENIKNLIYFINYVTLHKTKKQFPSTTYCVIT